MIRVILGLGMLALAACSSSGDSSAQRPVHGFYGAFTAGPNAL